MQNILFNQQGFSITDSLSPTTVTIDTPLTVTSGTSFGSDVVITDSLTVLGNLYVSGTITTNLVLNPNYYIDPINGNDGNNHSGTIGDPLASMGEALKRLSLPYSGSATVNFVTGTFDLTNIPTIILPSNQGVGIHSNPIMFKGLMIDGGLGTRTASVGTTGSGVTFGTVTDSTGGLTVNAWRGYYIRYTSGNNNGRTFMIASNTSNVFTICGAHFGTISNGDTFVVEKPGSKLSWTGNLSLLGNGNTLGIQNIELAGPGGSSVTRFTQVGLEVSGLWITGIGSGQCQLNHSSLSLLQQSVVFTNTGLTSTPIGVYFKSANGGNPLTQTVASRISIRRSLFDGCPIDIQQPSFCQIQDSYHVGNSYIRAINNSFISIIQNRLDTVSSAPVGPGGISGSAIVISNGATGFLQSVDISNTPANVGFGDGISVLEGSRVDISGVVGSGNTGMGIRTRRSSGIKNLLNNTISGSLGEIQLGVSGSSSTWAQANSTGSLTDIGSSLPEFCWIIS